MNKAAKKQSLCQQRILSDFQEKERKFFYIFDGSGRTMKLQLTKTFCATILLCISFLPVRSQLNICPSNLDFEFGNFNNWDCKTGSCSAASGQNIITWTGCCGPVSNRHEIIPGTSGAIDQYGLFPVVCPN